MRVNDVHRRKTLGFLVRFFSMYSAVQIFNIFDSTRPYKVIIVNKPRSTEAVTFNSTDEFWNCHRDNFSETLNEQFLAAGKLLAIDSFLSSDKSSLVLVKYYRTKKDHQEYVHLLHQHHLNTDYQKKTYSKTILT